MSIFFFFNDTATTEIYTLSLHDALPILWDKPAAACLSSRIEYGREVTREALSTIERGEDAVRALGFSQFRVRHHGQIVRIDRKSTRLNSSHGYISYAVFCLKTKIVSLIV